MWQSWFGFGFQFGETETETQTCSASERLASHRAARVPSPT
jgi:hypothetical protein